MIKAKIKIQRENLLYATDKAILFVKKKPVRPVNGMFKFVIKEESIDICAFDGETYAQVNSPCEVVGESSNDSFMVIAEKFHQLVKFCLEPEIELSFKKRGEGMIVVFKTTRSKHEFITCDDQMPIPQETGSKFTFDIFGSDLHNIADTVTNLIDESDASKKVTGMGLAFQYVEDAQALFVWGGSGHRMGGYKIPVAKPEGFESFIITKSAIKNMKKLVRGNEKVTVIHNGKICKIIGSDVFIQTSVVDAKYPPIYDMLKKLTGQKTIVTFSVSELKNAIDKLMLHTDEAHLVGKVSFGERSAKITIDNELIAQNGDEEIPYSSAERNEPLLVGANLKYFSLLLDQSISDSITFSVLAFNAPMLITSSSGTSQILFIFSPSILKEQAD